MNNKKVLSGNSKQALEVMKMVQKFIIMIKNGKRKYMKNKFFNDKSPNFVDFSKRYIEYLSYILKRLDKKS